MSNAALSPASLYQLGAAATHKKRQSLFQKSGRRNILATEGHEKFQIGETLLWEEISLALLHCALQV
jgi:hypothetical protein